MNTLYKSFLLLLTIGLGLTLSFHSAQAQDLAAASVSVSYVDAYPKYSEHRIDTCIRNTDYYPVLWGTRYAHLYMVSYHWNGSTWILKHNTELDHWRIDTLWAGACWYHTSYTDGFADSGDLFYYQLIIDGSDSNAGNNSTWTGWITEPRWIY